MQTLGLLCFLVATLSSVGTPAQEQTFIVDPVVVAGAKRYTSEQIASLSGLVAGSAVRIVDLEAAAQRLAATGLFSDVAYRYATANGRVTVTFDITEAEWTMPVGFDNFIWLSDEDLLADVRRKVPTFDGMSPNNGEVITYMTGVLQDILKARGLPGAVEHLPFLNTKTRAQMHLYKVARPSPMICAVRVTGTSAKWERALGEITTPMVGENYSRTYLIGMSAGTLVDLFRSQGHWAAEVAAPQASLSGGCSGVSVTVPVTEGPVFVWDETDWTGNVRLPAAELAKLTALRPGDVADGRNLEAALRRVRDAYGKVGHVTAAVAYRPELRTESKRVRIALEVTEGPQFRMGTLEIIGLRASDTENLQRKWRLKAGEIYDASYSAKFWADEVRPMLKRLNLRVSAPEIRADRTRLTVNVRITAQK